jgi:signal transduction histidine kinase
MIGIDGVGSSSARTDLPATIVRHVEQTREMVVLGDAAIEGRFRSDAYVARERPRSVLCMPLLDQDELEGVLYLEHLHEAFVFTPARCEALAVLVAQAAMAIAHARRCDERAREQAEELARARALVREAHEQLVAQEKLASLGRLTSGIAHEIKNPLNFVNNFAELSVELTAELLEELGGERRKGGEVSGHLDEIVGDLQQNVAKIREHGRRADGIVRSMLEHSRGRVGQPREVSFNSLVRDYTSAALQAHRLSAVRPVVETRLDEGAGAVTVVPEEIGRVILNLVDNALYAVQARARSAGPAFSPVVIVTTRGLGDHVEVKVRDNGGGIPAAIRDKVYDPFFTTKPHGEGTGLGLPLSQDIVAHGHGGQIAFETEDGAYTEFTVTLPRHHA